MGKILETMEDTEKSIKVYEATTTESGTTLSQSEQRKKEKDEVLLFAASLMEKLRQVDKQLETTLLDSKSVSQIQARSHLISTQILSMVDAVRTMTDLNDDNQYLALVKVCCLLFKPPLMRIHFGALLLCKLQLCLQNFLKTKFY